MSSWQYSELSDDDLNSVDALCIAFEQGLLGEESISIEAQLAAGSEHIRRPLFRELLAIELEQRQSRNDSPKILELQSRFPGLDSDIHQVFREVAGVLHGDKLEIAGSTRAA